MTATVDLRLQHVTIAAPVRVWNEIICALSTSGATVGIIARFVSDISSCMFLLRFCVFFVADILLVSLALAPCGVIRDILLVCLNEYGTDVGEPT